MRARRRWSRREWTGRWPLLAVLAVVTALAAVGCGGSSGVNDAVGRSAPPGTESPVPFAAATATSVTTAPPSADISAFCQDVQQLQALVPTLFRSGGPLALARARALAGRLTGDAPKEMRPAAQVTAQDTGRLITDFGTNPPDLADVARVLTDPSYQQAFQQVVTYVATHC